MRCDCSTKENYVINIRNNQNKICETYKKQQQTSFIMFVRALIRKHPKTKAKQHKKQKIKSNFQIDKKERI